ncbi:hypothetical protein QM467_00625 [Rhodoblastus sp. 17X3]|uniref:hypothetical protein n=1 Tax=Rhodoblastus sp. 17X3 TaxID=3047026 RepID=UPI0024B6AFF3|nr:hypothetical protein [Rhodoblastus sp. 17X3]MDI9846555.1 hypothetical protein [Rhodoblastus sp. 17X3]
MPKGYPKSGSRKISPENRCTVCKHPERPRIEALRCAGVSLDKLAEQFDLHRDAIWRHMERHVSDDRKASYLIGAGKIAKLAEVAAEESQSLIDYYAILRSALFYQFDRLAAKDDLAGVVAISARLTDVLKEIGRVTGQVSTIASSTIVNVQNNFAILNSQPFSELQAGLIQVCAAHPEARADIVALFKRLDEKYNAAPMINGAPPKLMEATRA